MINKPGAPQFNKANSGTLYIVPTPIGNLGDMVPRAVDILQTVDLIAAEDTRHSKKLMQHFNISTAMQPYHDHSDEAKVLQLMDLLEQGQSIALISDAGTPLISDPGYRLVHLARSKGLSVVPIPGACALVAALSASGLPSDRFAFEGFLPAKKVAREKALSKLSVETCTLIFYESSHRILESLQDVVEVMGGERYIVVARELTKTFETFLSGSAQSVYAQVEADPNQRKGEFVLMIKGAERQEGDELAQQAEQLMGLLLDEKVALKQAAVIASKHTGEKKNRLYDWGLKRNQSLAKE